MRSWLRHLAATGRLEVARAGISLEFELAAVASRLDGAKACLIHGRYWRISATKYPDRRSPT
jgi:3-polyprenyl-4-hydroxybenzoate decarboxylase